MRHTHTVTTEVGDGRNTLFGKDKWLHGPSIAQIAPRLDELVPRRVAIAEGLLLTP